MRQNVNDIAIQRGVNIIAPPVVDAATLAATAAAANNNNSNNIHANFLSRARLQRVFRYPAARPQLVPRRTRT